jgi:hypothetical protein
LEIFVEAFKEIPEDLWLRGVVKAWDGVSSGVFWDD